jgi:phosphatidylserine/phosphatidylglycerophosphate/cardiolipin synthase-like enzyme
MRTSRLLKAARPQKQHAPGRGRGALRTKALPGRPVTVLYTTGAIFKEIRRLFANPTSTDRRVAVVAYVGADALAFLPSPRGIDVVCSPTPLGTSHVGVKKLIKRGAQVRVADRLHMKVYWSERRGCVITSANLSTNALRTEG